mgnify:CR=1 FL=1
MGAWHLAGEDGARGVRNGVVHVEQIEPLVTQRLEPAQELRQPAQIAGEGVGEDLHRDRAALDHVLAESIPKVPYVTYLYALDNAGKQISSNAFAAGLIPDDFGRDRSARPYLMDLPQDRHMTLSEAYISLRAERPSVTAIQRVFLEERQIGYLGADFDLRGLPITKHLYSEPTRWRQLKGDPAIRGNVFQQRRIQSRLDGQIDMILPVLEELIELSGLLADVTLNGF